MKKNIEDDFRINYEDGFDEYDDDFEEHEKASRPFRVRSYGKSELAALYLPSISAGSATKTLRRWINLHPSLLDALAKTGLKPRNKFYTPVQVRLIVEAFGEP